MVKCKNHRIKSLWGNKLIIDADYADNSSNEGHIYFQVINLSPCPLYIKAGEVIGQATFIPYGVTDDDKADGDRTGGFGSTGTAL